MHETVHLKLAFIGGGNMAAALVGGLVEDGWPSDRIVVSDPDAGRRAALAARYAVHTTPDNRAAAAEAEVLVLAVKPQVLRAVCTELAPTVQQTHPLVLSIAAGVRSADVERWLGGGVAVVRCMPNTPALVGAGATALVANPAVDAAGRETAEHILRAVGVTVWLEQEALMDAATAVSGSGPAYFFLFMEALMEAGTGLGLSPEVARLLTLQTALGAARLALASEEDPAVLRQRVTSPGGTTERALAVLEDGGLRRLVRRAADAAAARSRELAEELAKGGAA
ncbi:MAG TPA: pyrroline-5-carboxylate reductase [Chromatiales bacterium]|nr:pyrroline-5-carboxylate reductase [Chromatiales bacterium]